MKIALLEPNDHTGVDPSLMSWNASVQSCIFNQYARDELCLYLTDIKAKLN